MHLLIHQLLVADNHASDELLPSSPRGFYEWIRNQRLKWSFAFPWNYVEATVLGKERLLSCVPNTLPSSRSCVFVSFDFSYKNPLFQTRPKPLFLGRPRDSGTMQYRKGFWSVPTFPRPRVLQSHARANQYDGGMHEDFTILVKQKLHFKLTSMPK